MRLLVVLYFPLSLWLSFISIVDAQTVSASVAGVDKRRGTNTRVKRPISKSQTIIPPRILVSSSKKFSSTTTKPLISVKPAKLGFTTKTTIFVPSKSTAAPALFTQKKISHPVFQKTKNKHFKGISSKKPERKGTFKSTIQVIVPSNVVTLEKVTTEKPIAPQPPPAVQINDMSTKRDKLLSTAQSSRQVIFLEIIHEENDLDETEIPDACPTSLDAFCAESNTTYIFKNKFVYQVRDDTVEGVKLIRKLFPRGPRTVNAAYYEEDTGLIILFEGRKVYAYKRDDQQEYKLDDSFPKRLPENIKFTPHGALRWQDRHRMVLAGDGTFALYDEYWNKSLITSQIPDHFPGLPLDVRGCSTWREGETKIFTDNMVFTYDALLNTTIGDGTPLRTFFVCKE
ncbi:hypothetical protein Q1695_002428 [Nippostrongylus brasiliensis]|nr:hypothetical protein Q1695_002428 [Nippostrongylus brasiliensis]